MLQKGTSETNNIAPLIGNREGIIKGRLFILQQALEDLKNDVDRSYALHDLGEKTEIVKQIENMLDNPLNSIFEMTEEFDNFINSIVSTLIYGFLKSKKDLIKSIYSERTNSNDLFYAIVLNNDNLENRSAILRFYDFFYSLDISRKYPINIQFVPSSLENKFSKFKQISFEA